MDSIFSKIIITIFLLILIYVFYQRNRFRFEFNYKFFLVFLPYLFFGLILEKYFILLFEKLLTNNLGLSILTSQLIGFFGNWLLVFFLFCLGLILSDSFNRISYRKTGLFGFLICLFFFSFSIFLNNYDLFNANTVFYLLILTGISFVVIFGLRVLVFKILNYDLFSNKLNFFVSFGQILDGFSTVAIIFLGFSSVHFFFELNKNLLNIIIWLLIKIIFSVIICFVFDMYKNQNINKKNFVGYSKSIIGWIGFLNVFKNLFLLLI
ncbi:MAG: DUF63 family protein [Candidatus ainarchaeum sp.]|nr:DUF63 family protein [Candidatus ainarchaeum sp.]